MRTFLVIVLIAALGAVPAAAQTAPAQQPTSRFELLLAQLFDDEIVWVTDGSGKTVKARVVSRRDGVLTVAIRNVPRVFTERDVGRVQRRVADPKWNGAIIGAAVGLTVNLIFCSPRYESGESCGENIDDIAIGTAASAGIGLWIDALKKSRRTVYTAQSPASLRLTPMVSPRGAGVLVTARY
jgi:hypothetical protein